MQGCISWNTAKARESRHVLYRFPVSSNFVFPFFSFRLGISLSFSSPSRHFRTYSHHTVYCRSWPKLIKSLSTTNTSHLLLLPRRFAVKLSTLPRLISLALRKVYQFSCSRQQKSKAPVALALALSVRPYLVLSCLASKDSFLPSLEDSLYSYPSYLGALPLSS